MNLTFEQLEDIAEIGYAAVSAFVSQQDGKIRPSWLGCSREYKNKFVNAIKIIVTNINKSPYEIHNAWLVKRKSEGWKYADFTDKMYLLSPQIIEYDKLDHRLRQRDAMLHAIVRTMLETQ